jgi:TRAP-type mannitol/chloroaromatic compound transport system permease large subunit
MTAEILAFIMFRTTLLLVHFGFPIALKLGGSALLFAFLADYLDLFRRAMLNFYPTRLLSVMLGQSQLVGRLLETMGRLFGRLRGGLGISVVIGATLLALQPGSLNWRVIKKWSVSKPPKSARWFLSS